MWGKFKTSQWGPLQTVVLTGRPLDAGSGTRLGLLQCAVDGLAGDTEIGGDLSDGAVPSVLRLPNQLDLPWRELRLLPTDTPAGSGGGQAIHRALAHQRVLKLPDSTDDLKEQAPNRRRGIDPLVEYDQIHSPGLQELGDLNQMLERAPETVKLRDDELVAGALCDEQRLVQLWASGELAAGVVDEDPLASSGSVEGASC
jgi:hypothetical protein